MGQTGQGNSGEIEQHIPADDVTPERKALRFLMPPPDRYGGGDTVVIGSRSPISLRGHLQGSTRIPVLLTLNRRSTSLSLEDNLPSLNK